MQSGFMLAAARARLPRVALVASAIMLCAYLLALLSRFRAPGELYLSYFTDDFYYYLVIAKNIVSSGMSSFNGIQLTNGYHPLWLVVITGLVAALGSGLPFFVTLTLLIWLLVAGTFVQLLRLSRSCSSSSPYAYAAALFSALYMAVLARTGMEISLGLFFLATFYLRVVQTPLEQQSARQAMLTGLVASLAMLARIDACIGVGLYVLFTLLGAPAPRRLVIKTCAWCALGGSLVLVYLAINHHLFGTWLPISGMAKNLKHGLAPSAAVLERLLQVDAINALFTWPSLALAVLYLARASRPGAPFDLQPASSAAPPSTRAARSGVPSHARGQGALTSTVARVRLACVLHPLAFYTVLSCTSDWTIWTWYLYPLVPIAALVLPHALELYLPRLTQALPALAVTAVALAGIGLSAQLAKLNPEAVSIYAAGAHLREFAKQHPGRYAMGDRAGTPGYLLGQPVIQLEGLVGDLPYLARLKRQQPLLPLLRELEVDYYVGTNPAPQSGCYTVREPGQAGPTSPALTGRLCSPPLTRFTTGNFTTLVFAVQAERDGMSARGEPKPQPLYK
jgi:hypothetical protein